jgi:hypothetical protein
MENFDARWDMLPLCPAGPYTVEDILKGNFVMTCTTVLRRELIPSFPKWLFEMKLGDWPLWIMVARYGKIELMDEIMGAYRVHCGGVWTSMPQITQKAEEVRMLRTLDKELMYQYTDIIRETIAPRYLSLAIASREKDRRIETAKHFINYIRSGGLRRSDSARLIASMIVYEVIGPWYKVFARGQSVNHG